MNPLISIIIVNWNGKKWLAKCLDSLLNQTYKRREIIVVDNGSSDGSVEYINKNYKSVRVIGNKKNLGFAGGNNIGIRAAKGTVILLINSDTWVDKTFLEDLYGFYKKGKYDVVGPYENNYQNTTSNKYIPTIDFLGHTVALRATKHEDTPKKMFYKSGVCLLFGKKLYQNTKGLDNDFFMYVEEVDWFWRLHLLKKKIGVADLYVHHAGAGSTGSGLKYNTFLWRNQNTLQMLLKNYSWYTLLWVLPLYLLQNVFEMVAFLFLLRPKIAASYIEGIMYNIKNLKAIRTKRAWVQKHRLIPDSTVMKKMYVGSGKIRHLLSFVK